MSNTRQRPFLPRACKQKVGEEKKDESIHHQGECSTWSHGDEVILDPNMWKHLDSTLTYKVLSFLPVHTLVETLRIVDPRWVDKPWFATYTFPSQFFGHGNNLQSSFGFVVKRGQSVCTFEHETNEWKEFPMVPPQAFVNATISFGTCDGLVLLENKSTSHHPLTPNDSGVKIGIWNPLFGAFKWLPSHPKHLNVAWSQAYCASRHLHLMVDSTLRMYKVFAYYNARTPTPNSWFYTIYCSIKKKWSNSLPMPVVDMFAFPCISASSNQYVCIEALSINPPLQAHLNEEILCCYDLQHGFWITTTITTTLLGLASSLFPGRVYKAYSKAYHILGGRLYILVNAMCDRVAVNPNVDPIMLWPHDAIPEYFLTSLDLSTMGSISSEIHLEFKFEFILPRVEVEVQQGKHARNYFMPSLQMFSYTMHGEAYIGVHFYNRDPFWHYNITTGKWSEHAFYPTLGSLKANISSTFLYTPSFIVP